MSNQKFDKRGMIIVFTLILLAVFLTAALGFSYFIIGDINKARAIDDSVIAYYSADAGMEESLYLLQKQTLPGLLGDLKNIRPGSNLLATSKGVWDILGSTNFETTVLRQRLYNGQSAKFFILNRGLAPGDNQTESISVEWYKGGPMTSNLQVNLTQLAPQQDIAGNLIYYQDTSALEVYDSGYHGIGAACYDLKDTKLGGSSPSMVDYLAEFKVLGATDDFVDRLIVKAYNSIDCTGNINREGITNLTLKSQGVYGQATQNIFAQILPKDPVSGLLGFVLFSEQDVTKE